MWTELDSAILSGPSIGSRIRAAASTSSSGVAKLCFSAVLAARSIGFSSLIQLNNYKAVKACIIPTKALVTVITLYPQRSCISHVSHTRRQMFA